jgi:hypothetical protein
MNPIGLPHTCCPQLSSASDYQNFGVAYSTLLCLAIPTLVLFSAPSANSAPVDNTQPCSNLAEDLSAPDLSLGAITIPTEQERIGAHPEPALADRAPAIDLQPEAPSTDAEATPEPSEDPSEPTPKPLDTPSEKYGQNGQGRWYIQGGAGIPYDPDAANYFGLLGVGITHFFANGHSINAEVNSFVFNQTGSDAVGINLGLIGRWHFIRRRNWSLFVDGGVGILGTTNNVPPSGTNFNFTPQVGGGATIRLAQQRRLLLGLRWHHISNADLSENNPGQNAVLGYVGLELPR